MTIEEIGCCGAYCKPCLERQRKNHPDRKNCQGCKLGYATCERNINRARCKVKSCCYKDRELQTCADCDDYPCYMLQKFYERKKYPGTQYRASIEFIRKHGYDAFLKKGDQWSGRHGKLVENG